MSTDKENTWMCCGQDMLKLATSAAVFATHCIYCGRKRPVPMTPKAAKWCKLMGVYLKDDSYSIDDQVSIEAAERAWDAAEEMFTQKLVGLLRND